MNPSQTNPESQGSSDDQDGKLFEQLGGAESLAAIVTDMYERIFQDPSLAPFFANTHADRLRKMQYHFLAAALDGPVEYSGAELGEVHHGRGITGQHFASFCGHFADAMEAAKIEPVIIDQCLGRLAMYRGKVIGEVGVDG